MPFGFDLGGKVTSTDVATEGAGSLLSTAFSAVGLSAAFAGTTDIVLKATGYGSLGELLSKILPTWITENSVVKAIADGWNRFTSWASDGIASFFGRKEGTPAAPEAPQVADASTVNPAVVPPNVPDKRSVSMGRRTA